MLVLDMAVWIVINVIGAGNGMIPACGDYKTSRNDRPATVHP